MGLILAEIDGVFAGLVVARQATIWSDINPNLALAVQTTNLRLSCLDGGGIAWAKDGIYN
jgi:hypothetical protein